MGMDKVPWVGTVDPRAAVGRIWVQLSSPMQDSAHYFPTGLSRSFPYPVSTAVLRAPNPGRSTEGGGNVTRSSCDLLHKQPSPVTTILSRNRHRKRQLCYEPVTGNDDSGTNPSPVTTTLLQIISNTVAGRSVPPE